MTTTNERLRRTYDGDGSTTVFPVDIYYTEPDQISVTLRDAAGGETDWVLGVNYSLTTPTAGDEDVGGTLTVITSPTDFTPQIGEALAIRIDAAAEQTTALPLGGPFPSTAVERALDYNIAVTRSLQEQVARAVLLSVTSEQTSPPTLPDPETGRALQWDDQGNLINTVNDYDSISSQVTADAASASAAATTALDAATEAEADATAAAASAVAADVARIEWRGDWDSGTAYAVNDAVALSGSSYICIQAHTNQSPPNATFWDLLAEAGVDGGGAGTVTQVNTAGFVSGGPITATGTITLGNQTAGDLIRYNVTTGVPERLPVGAVGQFLRVVDAGGGNLHPAWGAFSLPDDSVGPDQLQDTAVTPGSYTNTNITVDQQGRVTAASTGAAASGGWTLLESRAPTGVVNEDFTWDTDTYGSIRIVIDGVDRATGTGRRFHLRFGYNDGANIIDSSGSYRTDPSSNSTNAIDITPTTDISARLSAVIEVTGGLTTTNSNIIGSTNATYFAASASVMRTSNFTLRDTADIAQNLDTARLYWSGSSVMSAGVGMIYVYGLRRIV